MANFAGLDLGIIEKCKTTLAPRARQVNAYNGVDGLEVIDLGGRGGETKLRGVLAGVDEADLESIKGAFYAAQADGGAYTFVDNKDNDWENVILVAFEPDGTRIPGLYVPGVTPNGICERYELTLLHIDG